ncbi:hypothetical protein WMY93_022872 [Mugilogobius chulae]|uniref:Uncharacterized protein n=1 Tax=Mugilogobius chulae TaxID=88201 RepID=A0AAW0N2S5_9GOBI
MTQMNGSMNALNEQIAEIQIRVSAVEDNFGSTDKKVKDLIKRVEFLEDKVDYMENKSRQNNVVIFGIAEGEEKKDTVVFVQSFLTKTLSLSPDFTPCIEIAHRISAKVPVGKKPRPIIAKFGIINTKQK